MVKYPPRDGLELEGVLIGAEQICKCVCTDVEAWSQRSSGSLSLFRDFMILTTRPYVLPMGPSTRAPKLRRSRQ